MLWGDHFVLYKYVKSKHVVHINLQMLYVNYISVKLGEKICIITSQYFVIIEKQKTTNIIILKK